MHKLDLHAQITLLIHLLAVSLLETCGPITHIEIAHRAKFSFTLSSQLNSRVDYRKILHLHDGAYQAGSVYPDAFYDGVCFGGKYHDISEDTHWVPFVNATVNYYRNKYGNSSSVHGDKLLAFLFGVASHQVADVLWHSLDIQEGFLDVLAKVNFHDEYGVAHPYGDLVDDIITLYSGITSYIPYTTEWFVPVDDLYNIYKELYGSVRISKAVIQECTIIMFLTRFAEKLALEKGNTETLSAGKEEKKKTVLQELVAERTKAAATVLPECFNRAL